LLISYAALLTVMPWNIPQVTCTFSAHTKLIQVASVVFHGIPRESVA